MGKDYYQSKAMEYPTPEMYSIKPGERVLVVGTATPHPNSWAVTVDIDPSSPAQIRGDGLNLPFADGVFDVVILDFVTNFLPRRDVPRMIKEAQRVGKRVMGRCHVAANGQGFTLPGSKQRFVHPNPPDGVEWVEIRMEIPPKSRPRRNRVRKNKD